VAWREAREQARVSKTRTDVTRQTAEMIKATTKPRARPIARTDWGHAGHCHVGVPRWSLAELSDANTRVPEIGARVIALVDRDCSALHLPGRTVGLSHRLRRTILTAQGRDN